MSGSLLLAATAILFDCDGVLVDSDASVTDSWARWARRYGFDPDEVNAMVHGRRAADTVALLLPPEDVAGGVALINDYELEGAERVTAIPGAAALLAEMPAGRWAVVTSGTTTLATARLAAARLGRPPALVTADDVAAGKPAPDPFLAGAALLGLDPALTIVIEDSPNGIVAARAAGVGHVVGVGHRSLPAQPDVAVGGGLTGLSWDPSGLRLDATALLP